MDLRLYGQVIWRHKYLVAGGCLLAVVLTSLAMFRFTSDGIEWRLGKTYKATSTLLLKNVGGPNLDFGTVLTLDGEVGNSDDIRVLAFGRKPVQGSYLVTAVSGGSAIGPLPLLQVDGFAGSPRRATTIVDSVSRALRAYLPASVPGNRNVSFNVVSTPDHPVVSQGRKLTVPIVILLSVLVVTFGLAFLLENLSTRAPASARNAEPESGDESEAPRVSRLTADDGTSRNGGEGEAATPPARRHASRRT